MRFEVLSATTYATPPLGYGGEIFFWHLARGLCELGHKVTLWGAPGSLPPHPERECECRVRYIPGSYGDSAPEREYWVAEWYYKEMIVGDCVLDCSHMHFIADNAGWYDRDNQKKIAVVLNGVSSRTPYCGPYNVIVGSQKWRDLLVYGRSQFAGTPFAAKYGSDVHPILPQNIAGIVPWATDTGFYSPSSDSGAKDAQHQSYMLWLSRPTAYKGLGVAIEVAQRAGLHLKVCPGIGMADHRTELATFMPMIEAAQNAGAQIDVCFLPDGLTHHQAKREMYRNASALLYPVLAHEPFGLVVIEALSCGTPVIAMNMGAMPEIINHGETGFLCNSSDDIVDAVSHVKELNRDAIRKDSVERWHYTRAAKDYEKIVLQPG